jgi:diguanylate cyclase (GGDEF)-like protein
MHLSADKYFVLSVLLCVFLLGMVLLACWHVQRRQRYLPWLAAGYMLSALGLAWQSVLPPGEIARWSLVTGVIYLGGAWSLARGMAGRYGVSAHPWAALAIAAATLGVLHRYAFIHEDLWVRVYALNAGLGLLQMLPVVGILRSSPPRDRLERTVRWSYAVFAAYTMARPVLLLALAPMSRAMDISASGYWLATLAGTLLFALWFTAVLLACTVRNAIAALREERNRDPLTQLLNRRAFFEAAERSLGDARQGPWALLTCDIDHFKQVNDSHGHAAGDEALRRVARLLATQMRGEGDLVARFGGEEFVVLLQQADGHVAEAVATRIRQLLATTHIDAIAGAVTASFGVSFPASASDLPRALAQADALLYRAKQAGRDRVCLP